MTDNTTSCHCGSPTAEAMAPNERLVHGPDECFIERDVTGLPGFRSEAARTETVLDQILTELRRIADGIDRANRSKRKVSRR